MAVFSSAKPTVTARLVCPAAARDSNATITKANKLSLSPGTLKVCNRAAIKIRIACTKVLKSNQLRFLARARWASCANVKLPAQNLWPCQLYKTLLLSGFILSTHVNIETTTLASTFDLICFWPEM